MVEKKYIGTRIYRELLKMGYSGCVDNIWRYIRQVKQEQKKTKRITTRVATDPGQQTQYDWKELIPPLPSFLLASQNPIHRRNGTKINPFIQQTGVNFCWGLIRKSRLMERFQNLLFFFKRQTSRRFPRSPDPFGLWKQIPIKGSSGNS